MMRKLIAVLGFTLALAPLAAQAHDRDGDGYDDVAEARFAPPPAPPGGHYVWQNVSQWVPAHSEQYVIPGTCVTRGRRWHQRTRCTPSRYASRIIPGHYIPSGRWVWVADLQPYEPAPSGFELRVGPRGVRVGIHVNTVAVR